jgi:hypothetical protein
MVRLFSQIENSKEELLTPTEPVLDENEEFIENEEEINSDTSDSDDDTADIEHVDEEIGQELENLKLMEFKDNEETYEIVETSEIDYNQEYDSSRGDRIKNLDIKLGSDSLPRISCAAHKTNIGVRAAIKSHSGLSTMLKNLSKFCASSHRSIFKANYHNNNKSRLRCDNQTRWNSSFQMLVSVKKAYEKNTFNNEYQCPYTLNSIENISKF